MYTPGTIIYYTPFYFENGNTPKPKYLIILAVDNCNATLVAASLATSQDHVPTNLPKTHGCIHNNDMRFNCYYYEALKPICCNDFGFPLDTYIYGEQVNTFYTSTLQTNYPKEGTNYIIKGKLTDKELAQITACVKKSANLKRKVKKLL